MKRGIDRKPVNLITDLNAPLPLGYHRALEKAFELRTAHTHWPYRVLADVMRIYHGLDRSPDWWGARMRERGVTPGPRRGDTIRLNRQPRD